MAVSAQRHTQIDVRHGNRLLKLRIYFTFVMGFLIVKLAQPSISCRTAFAAYLATGLGLLWMAEWGNLGNWQFWHPMDAYTFPKAPAEHRSRGRFSEKMGC